MGGSSGVLLAIFFAAMGDALSRGNSLLQDVRAGWRGCRTSVAQSPGTGR